MKPLKCALLIAILMVTISSTAFGGTIIGGRSSRTGTIIGGRTGTIIGGRTGTIIGGRTGNQPTPASESTDRSPASQGFRILLTENIFGVMRLFLESSLF